MGRSKRSIMRTIHTCFGEFEIETDSQGNGIARSAMDDDFYYHLPMPNMTNDEIKDYFRILQEMEE